ncbi:hypothetical protein GOV08_01385 [Candidatus Woesearchaeota archaeon]|nr:hypothetical protein [Candidatus Woesearchaeota archaeon]
MKNIILSNKEIIKETVNFERIVKQSMQQKAHPFIKGFKIFKGDIPVIISAPHSARTIRKGVVKKRDSVTGTIAYLLHKLTGAYAFVTLHLDKDSNYYEDTKYKKYIKKIILEKNIKFLIDIHGCSAQRPFSIDLGTNHHETIKNIDKIISILKNSFKKQGITKVNEDFFNFKHGTQQTMTMYASYYIPAVQIEINKDLRNFDNNPELFISLINALKEAVGKILHLLES